MRALAASSLAGSSPHSAATRSRGTAVHGPEPGSDVPSGGGVTGPAVVVGPGLPRVVVVVPGGVRGRQAAPTPTRATAIPTAAALVCQRRERLTAKSPLPGRRDGRAGGCVVVSDAVAPAAVRCAPVPPRRCLAGGPSPRRPPGPDASRSREFSFRRRPGGP